MNVAVSPIVVLLAVLVVVALLVGARSRAMAWTGLLLVAAIVVSLAIVGWFSVREQTALLEQTARVAKPGVPAPVPTDPSGAGQTAAGVPEVPATPLVPPQRPGPAIRPASTPAVAPSGQRPRKLAAFFRALAASVDGERNVNIAKRNAYGALLAVFERGGALVAPPGWIESASRWLDDGTAYQTTAITRFVTLEGLFDEIDGTLCQATLHYVRDNFGDDFGETLPLNGKELRRLIADRYYEYHTVEVGGDRQRLVRAHLLLTFDEAAHDELQKLYDQAAAEQHRIDVEIAVQQREMTIARRLRTAGGILVGILGMLALVYGYLRFLDDPRVYYGTQIELMARPAFGLVSLATLGYILWFLVAEIESPGMSFAIALLAMELLVILFGLSKMWGGGMTREARNSGWVAVVLALLACAYILRFFGSWLVVSLVWLALHVGMVVVLLSAGQPSPPEQAPSEARPAARPEEPVP